MWNQYRYRPFLQVKTSFWTNPDHSNGSLKYQDRNFEKWEMNSKAFLCLHRSPNQSRFEILPLPEIFDISI